MGLFMNTLFWNLNYFDAASTLAGEVDNPASNHTRAVGQHTKPLLNRTGTGTGVVLDFRQLHCPRAPRGPTYGPSVGAAELAKPG